MPPCHGGGRGFESRPVRKSPLKKGLFVMKHYVYIIQSDIDGSFYTGYSLDPLKRLLEHNSLENPKRYSFHLKPWKLVYIEAFDSYELAIKREHNLKQASRKRILEIIKLPKNIL